MKSKVMLHHFMLDWEDTSLEICTGILVLKVLPDAGFVSELVKITNALFVRQDVAVLMNVSSLQKHQADSLDSSRHRFECTQSHACPCWDQVDPECFYSCRSRRTFWLDPAHLR
jgi:hypothetical protein